MDFLPVLTKVDFARRYLADEFGNRSPSWRTVDEYAKEGYTGGLVHVRNRVAGGPTWYDTPPHQVLGLVRQVVAEGLIRLEDIYLSAMAPTPRTMFQGEVSIDERGLCLYSSTVPAPMRQSLIEGGQQTFSLTAKLRLQYHVPPGDLDWIYVLLDRYDGHVVEFSCYAIPFGTLNQRTVVWEVRNY